MSSRVKHGYFYKESNSFPWNWQKRFFQLFEEETGNYMLYHKTEGDGRPRGRIPISKVLDVFPYTEKPSEKRFKVITPTRTYFMKGLSVEDRVAWVKTILDSVKTNGARTMGLSDAGALEGEEAVGGPSSESLDTRDTMQEFVASINDGLRFLNATLAGKDCFNKFALHMQGSSYFDLAIYGPIFERLYRDFYDSKFNVEVKLEKTSSVDLAKEKFEKFLMIIEQKRLRPNLKAALLEERVSEAALQVLATVAKYKSEAAKAKDADIIKGVQIMDDFFQMLVHRT